MSSNSITGGTSPFPQTPSPGPLRGQAATAADHIYAHEHPETERRRIGWVAARLTRHGAAVIAAAISPYEETRQRARDLV